MKTYFRVVPDTNVVIASEKSKSESSPNKEFFVRWKNHEFQILYSDSPPKTRTMRLRHISSNIFYTNPLPLSFCLFLHLQIRGFGRRGMDAKLD